MAHSINKIVPMVLDKQNIKYCFMYVVDYILHIYLHKIIEFDLKISIFRKSIISLKKSVVLRALILTTVFAYKTSKYFTAND